jgi:hypothetical protein
MVELASSILDGLAERVRAELGDGVSLNDMYGEMAVGRKNVEYRTWSFSRRSAYSDYPVYLLQLRLLVRGGELVVDKSVNRCWKLVMVYDLADPSGGFPENFVGDVLAGRF